MCNFSFKLNLTSRVVGELKSIIKCVTIKAAVLSNHPIIKLVIDIVS